MGYVGINRGFMVMFIFRWKVDGIEVRPSRKPTEVAVWTWAIEHLRPCDMDDDGLAEKFIRTNGEVVEVSE